MPKGSFVVLSHNLPIDLINRFYFVAQHVKCHRMSFMSQSLSYDGFTGKAPHFIELQRVGGNL